MAVDEVKKQKVIIDLAIPEDIRVSDKEQEKIKKYSLLTKIARLWQMKKVLMIPIVVGALQTLTLNFKL